MRNLFQINFPVDSRYIPNYYCDVLIIGSGIAGLRCAIHTSQYCDTILITKGRKEESATYYAQGGIAVAIQEGDDPRYHLEDTLKVGGGICNKKAVEVLTYEGIERVKELIEWGIRFDKKDGKLHATREGGHSFPRVLHANGDATGKEIVRFLLEKSDKFKIFEHWMAVKLNVVDNTCYGVLVFDIKNAQFIKINSRITVIATGGVGQIYRETTNPSVATGDGISMAVRAGARVKNMEFVQFHPTVLYLAGAPRFLISEAVRGEGAILVDDEGTRFMEGVHPQKELAPRDIVSQAIIKQMHKRGISHVYLDLRHIPSRKIKERFPNILRICKLYGIDITKDLIPVSPCAHYIMGGIHTDLHGRTSIKNLYACGEVSCTGVHGANRLASNSLLEGLVFGFRVAEDIIKRIKNIPLKTVHLKEEGLESLHIDIIDAINSLRTIMWRKVGIERTPKGMREALIKIEFWSKYLLNTTFDSRKGIELQNMLITSYSVVKSAIKRKYSIGSHYLVEDEKDR